MRFSLIALSFCVALSSSPAIATPLSPFIDLQERGLTLTGAATGGELDSSSGLTVSVGGTVRFGLLYWSGATACTAPCTVVQPFGDQQIVFNGTPLTGTVIGTDEAAGAQNIGYFADVTSLVSAFGPGTHSFTLADGDTSKDLDILDGFGLMVGYTDPGSLTFNRVQIVDGLEALGAGDAASVTFTHGAADFGRAAELFLLGGNGTSAPSDYVTVGSGAAIGNPFSGAAGPRFDLYRREFALAAGVASTGVTVGVAECGVASETIRWQLAALVTTDAAGTASGGSTAGPSCAAVPEPTSLHLAGTAALLGLLRLRQRRRTPKRAGRV